MVHQKETLNEVPPKCLEIRKIILPITENPYTICFHDLINE